MPDKHILTLHQAKDLATNVTAGVLNRPVADLTNGSPLDSDDLDLVLTELSLAGIEVGRDRIKTVGDLIERLRARPSAPIMTRPSERVLTLRQADQARTDFALIEEQSRISCRPTRQVADARRSSESRPRDDLLHGGADDSAHLDCLALARSAINPHSRGSLGTE